MKKKHVHDFKDVVNPLVDHPNVYYAAKACACGKWKQLDGRITNSSSGRTKHGRK